MREEQNFPLKPCQQHSSISTNTGHQQRSMSQRELAHHSDGIVDAFGFAATSGYHSFQPGSSLHYSRHDSNLDFSRRPSETARPTNYQPLSSSYHEPRSNYSERNRSIPMQHKTSLEPTMLSSSNTDKENYQAQQKVSWNPPRHRNSFLSKSHEPEKQTVTQLANKNTFGPVVRRTESMKKIMQKNRNAENNSRPAVTSSLDSGGNEVITEKGRSVKSIVGMFDQPAIHAVLAKAKTQQANGSIKEEASEAKSAQQSTNSNKNERKETQSVHIAKFMPLDSTPEKSTKVADAQTSPMQLSPTETYNNAQNSVCKPSIVKAETYSGLPKPEVAVITSSTSSSYMSNEVFTPGADSVESPVFEADSPQQRSDSNSHSAYLDGINTDGFDFAHNSYIPNSFSQPYSPQHPHIHNQLMRQGLADTESSNHYEDLDSLRPASSIHDIENIYEPISPMQREPNHGNYMNFPTSSSTDGSDVSPTHFKSSNLDRRSMDKEHMRPMSLPIDVKPLQHPTQRGSEFNDSHEEESYSNQVREASHRTLRQTSAEGGRYRSPTREEQSSRYNQPTQSSLQVQGISRKTPPVLPAPSSNRSGSQLTRSPYSSDLNVSNHDSVIMRNRQIPHRTDSWRVPPRTKQVDRTSSYRESRGSSMDVRGSDHKTSIRDNLIDFYKRKSRDSSMDGMVDNIFAPKSNSSPFITSSSVAPQERPMQRIQSERAFNTRNPRADSLDRTSSAQAASQHRNSADLSHLKRNDSQQAYMQSWDASTIVSAPCTPMGNERSPTSASTPTESPRVRKPLAEVNPFSMVVRPSRLEMNSSSSTTVPGVLKPVKASSLHPDSGNNYDVAPTLPPRNYHREDIVTVHSGAPDSRQSASEMDLSGKPHQSVFNGVATEKTGDDYDAGYAEQLRKLSKNQYVRPSSELNSKLSPQQPVARVNGQHQSHQSASSPQNPSSLNNTGNVVTTPDTNSAANVSPHNNNVSGVTSSHAGVFSNKMADAPRHRHSMSFSHSVTPATPAIAAPRVQARHPILHLDRQQVLETDIDDPESKEAQPLPPPRRQIKNDVDEQKPPPKPPKLSSTIYHPEINHNDSKITPLEGKKSPRSFSDSIENKISTPPDTSNMHHKKSVQLSNRLHEGDNKSHDRAAQPRASHPRTPPTDIRKERIRSESMISPKGEDLTVTSGDPTAHLNRRHSLGKIKSKRSVSSAGTTNKEDRLSTSVQKPSPANRLHKRETEFSSTEKLELAAKERLAPSILTDIIHENRPKPVPFDRYHPISSSHENLVSNSRHGSSELLETIQASPVSNRRKQGVSPIPRTRSPRLSPTSSKSVRASIGSLCDSRKSSPSPHSNCSDVVKPTKSDPSTPIDKSFVPISAEILAELADQGIDITERPCISDENKARLVKISTLNSSSPPPRKKPPSIQHIRQKSSDEILCDTQVENLGRYIKDETLSQVLSKPERGTTDYLPGLFDDLLNKDIPRKPRQSVDSSPCHSKQSSDGDSLVSSKTNSVKDLDTAFDTDLKATQDKKGELVLVLKKKLSVLQGDEQFTKQEIEDNETSGTELMQLVETKCSEREMRKFKSYIGDVETITRLLLKLSRRLARAENELRNAPMDATDDDKKSLEQKRNGLQRQHTEAKTLKGNIDRRKALVDSILNRCLDSEQFRMYDHYISIKLKLIMEISDIEDQVAHCEEQITAVTAISN
ncbi:serine/arginine repetitive matrix protein 2-like isoform X2 [Watersipora subatra]